MCEHGKQKAKCKVPFVRPARHPAPQPPDPAPCTLPPAWSYLCAFGRPAKLCAGARGWKQNIQDCSPRYAEMLAAKATMTAEKAAEREKRAAKKRKRVARLAAEKLAMKAAERDPQRLMPGLSRLQLASVKTEMCTRGKSFTPWSEPVPLSAAAIAELAKIAAEKKSEAAAKRDQSKKRREDKHAAERRDTIIAFGAQQLLSMKREPGAEESMGPPPPPPPLPVHISNGDEVRCCGFLWIASVASRL